MSADLTAVLTIAATVAILRLLWYLVTPEGVLGDADAKKLRERHAQPTTEDDASNTNREDPKE